VRCFFLVAIVQAAGALAAQAGPIRQITLATRDIVYDPVSKKIYASVPASAGPLGNTVTVIDPVTGSVGPSVFVGSEPGKLAISDDGQFLYVALEGAGAVRQVSLPQLVAGLQFSVGTDAFFGPMFVEDMAVLPGNSQSVAISRKFTGLSPRHAGVAIYDAGVARSTATPGHTGSNVIEFGTGASILYGYNNETTEFGFRRMTVSASGVSVLDTAPNLFTNFNVDFEVSGGRAYSTSGRVVDVATVSLVGTLPGVAPFGALVEPDAAAGRAFFLSDNTILAFSNATLTPVGTRAVPGILGTPSSLIRWRETGLAFRTSANQVFLIETVLISCQPGDCQEPHAGGVAHDLDGDKEADIAVYRSSTGEWLVHRSSDGGLTHTSWGCPSCFDSPVPADFDGDAKADIAVHRFSTGGWFINRSAGGGLFQASLGCPSCADIPVPADYDGDGSADIAVYRLSTGEWLINRTGGGGPFQQEWGCPSCGDLPAPADYDGDKKIDVGVYRFSTGEWFINRSGGGFRHDMWGCGPCDDFPVAADYDGDGNADVAVYRFSTGEWFINRSGGGGLRHVSWGCASCDDVPVVADYDGDGKADIAVYRLPTGEWFVLRSGDSTLWHLRWGAPSLGDLPLELSPILFFIFALEQATSQ
jgi:hypothetical protein